MIEFADIHSHFLYGLDDGAATREDMLKLLDNAYVNGITKLIATPHCEPGVKPFDKESLKTALNEARSYCDEKGYNIVIESGAEVLYTPALEHYARRRSLPTLGNTGMVLLELAPNIRLNRLIEALRLMYDCDYCVVLAHIERYECLRIPFMAKWLKRSFKGLKYQVNAHSIIGLSGLAGFFLRSWLRKRLIDYVASDAHNVRSRPFLQAKAYKVLKEKYSRKYAEYLMCDRTTSKG